MDVGWSPIYVHGNKVQLGGGLSNHFHNQWVRFVLLFRSDVLSPTIFSSCLLLVGATNRGNVAFLITLVASGVAELAIICGVVRAATMVARLRLRQSLLCLKLVHSWLH